MSTQILKMSGIKKSFGEVTAIYGGDFTQYGGEIHSLIGENGAGKSTLMRILYGMYQPDEGAIEYEGRLYGELHMKQAIGLGIGMVHQEFLLVDDMTVLENLVLGFEPRRRRFQIDYAAAREQFRQYIETFGFDVHLDKKVRDISVGEAQKVEIIKALYRGARLLILDEPTALLTPQETVRLFDIIRALRQDGKSIIFISHKLNEVLEISDRITVMRQGNTVGTVNRGETSREELIRMMLNRDLFQNLEAAKSCPGEPLLEIKDIYVPGNRESSKLRGVSFAMRRGEILGVAGVDGNGQKELVEAITGIRKVQRGEILLLGKPVNGKSAKKVRRAGLAHIPEDRNTRGLNREVSIEKNHIALNFARRAFSHLGVISGKKTESFSRNLIERFDIRPRSPKAGTRNLSGGNAQKVVVSREIDANAPLLIAAQPTRGVDIGSIEQIRLVLRDAVERGIGVLLISADLEEILSLSHRIIVMYEGKIVGELAAHEANEQNLGLMMTGGGS